MGLNVNIMISKDMRISMTERVCENCRFYWNLWGGCIIFQKKVHNGDSCLFWGGKE